MTELRGLAAIPAVRRLIELALDEDYGRGDVTSRVTVGAVGAGADGRDVVADMTAREPLVVFGVDIAEAVFHMVDPRIVVERRVADGELVMPGTEHSPMAGEAQAGPGQRNQRSEGPGLYKDGRAVVMTVSGPAFTVLVAERTVLNFMQRLSGVATLAKKYVEAVAGTKARVIDTRKTTPGFRALEKAAVLAGGASNHRFDLGSGVLIKDNHIAACGGVTAAVRAAKANAPHPLKIECEVTNLAQLDEAIAAGADIVLLDNMTPAQVQVAAARAHERGAIVEVSGGITLATIAEYARAGADLISAGALTHSAPAVDLGLDFRA